MSSGIAAAQLTADEFLELPERGRDRMLICGKLWDRPMTYRNPFHSSVLVQLSYLLQSWVRLHPEHRLKVLGGDAGFLLRSEPDSIVGIDVAVARQDQPKYAHKGRVILQGHPLLAAEILSPSDRQRDIEAKVDEYLEVGVPLVWIVDPHYRTVTVHRPGLPPRMVTEQDQLTGEDTLPELRLQVREIFETM